MKTQKNSIIYAAVFYACSVVISEATFGNPDFFINLWRFELISVWQWSVPVHTAGFIWLFFCNRFFYDQSIMIPIVASLLFFIACEIANWSIFHFFVYEPFPIGEAYPTGAAGSFWLVIFLYSVLCTVTGFLFRTGND